MRKPFYWIWVAGLFAGGILVFLRDRGNLITALGQEAASSAAVYEQILAGTVQIEMTATGAGGETHIAQGLGTLVRFGEERFIMTHNHWPLSRRALTGVEIWDAAGEPLLLLDGPAFLSLMHYHDAGTLLLHAPAELQSVTAAEFADSAKLEAGTQLLLVTHDEGAGNKLEITTAQVEATGGEDMPGRLRLRGTRTAVAPGDSGGGVWHEGKVVGNLWAIVESLQDTPWAWQGWFGAPAEPQPTGAIFAAPQPLSELNRLAERLPAVVIPAVGDSLHGRRRSP